MYADSVISKLWLVRSFSSQEDPKVIANLASKNVTETRDKNARPHPSFAG